MMMNISLVLFVLWTNVTVGVSKRVNKRSDDTSPLEPVIMALSQRLNEMSADYTQLKSEVSDLRTKLEHEQRHVAFLAQFSQLEHVTPASGPFHFDHVVFNDGNNYDPSHGIFTAPVNGVYVISAKFFTDGNQTSHPVLDMKVNGRTQDRMSFGEQSMESGRSQNSLTTTMTLKLAAGDRVWVETYRSRVYKFFGTYHSFFTGALLYPQ